MSVLHATDRSANEGDPASTPLDTVSLISLGVGFLREREADTPERANEGRRT